MSQAKHIGKIVITQPDRLERLAHELLLQEEVLSMGIRPVEGMEVVDRILDQVPLHPEQQLSQVAVSTTDFLPRVRASYSIQHPGIDSRLETIKSSAPRGAVSPRPPLSTDYVPPDTEMEKQVTQIWQEFLGLEKVGIHDNFFELGASSLDIIQVNNKLNKLLEKELSVVDFYTYPSVCSLVQSLVEKPSMTEGGSKEKQSSRESHLNKSKKTFKDTIKKMKQFEKM
jgi:acyl carrier protein